MRNVCMLGLLFLSAACYQSQPHAEPKAAPTFDNDMSYAEKMAASRRECMKYLMDREIDYDLYHEQASEQLASSERVHLGKIDDGADKRSTKGIGIGYYRYEEYTVKGKTDYSMRSILAVEDDVCYCLVGRQDYQVELKERIVESPDSPGHYGKHGLLSLDLTNNSDNDKQPSLKFDLDTNAIFIRRRYAHSCDQIVISVHHGGPQDDGSPAGAEDISRILLNFNARDGKVFSSL